jgi:hypothetical protein
MRVGKIAYVIDWKFGSGVAVEPEANEQLMFYAAAAMRTPEVQWVFDGAETIELVIIQPPHDAKRWAVTRERLDLFVRDFEGGCAARPGSRTRRQGR